MDYPSNPDVRLLGGKFTDGNPLTDTPPSWIPADWMNAMSDEVIEVIQGLGGLVPAEEDRTQLRQAIDHAIATRLLGRSMGMTMITATTTFVPGDHGISETIPLIVSLWGAGGGASSLSGGAGGAGGAGGWAMATVMASEVVVTVGSGGDGLEDGDFGLSGGTTSWGSLFAATGGQGGRLGGGAPGGPTGAYDLGLIGGAGDDLVIGDGSQPIARGGAAPFLGLGGPVSVDAPLGAGGSVLLIPPNSNQAGDGGAGLALVFWPK
ncbi:hypothetical protein [Rhodospirillum sp. A1_3_36]|uniref:hypothetical protein n=1 Tax=Rhodospirillum sp. A1_3_36 TaxID=3391666 RepID=UPI0039A5275C